VSTDAASVVRSHQAAVSQPAHATSLTLSDVLLCLRARSDRATSVTLVYCLSNDSVNYLWAALGAGHMYVDACYYQSSLWNGVVVGGLKLMLETRQC